MKAIALALLSLSICSCSQPSMNHKRDFRSEVLTELEAKGLDTTKECLLHFYVFLPSEALAREFGERLMKEGKAHFIDIHPSPLRVDWLCRATTVLTPQTGMLNELRGFMDRLVQEFHADFDGWEAEQ
jgi:hypothetical protein